MTYHHLSREERYQISALLKEGLTQSQIAANLRRHQVLLKFNPNHDERGRFDFGNREWGDGNVSKPSSHGPQSGRFK